MNFALIAGLFASLLNAYQPGGVQPLVRSWVNFGQNPFIVDPNILQGFTQLPGYNYGSVTGNVMTSTSSNPGLYMSNQAFTVPGLGSEIEVTGHMAFQAEWLSGLLQSPAGIDLDPLYGTGQLGAFDPTQGWLFALMLTNLRVYALYSRLPLAQSPTNDYVAFSYLVPIATRGLYSSNDLSIVMNKAHFTVSYRIQGMERLFIERVGGPIDERFILADDGGLVQCMGFPDSFHVIIGTGMLPNAGDPYTVCQSQQVFDQCEETILEADHVVCDYQPMQNPGSYNVGLTLTIENFGVLEWAPNFDCINPYRLDVAAIRPEPLCFGNCPNLPVQLPPNTGCGIPAPIICSDESEEDDVPCGCPQVFRQCSVSTACTESSSCPLVYREINLPNCGCNPSSSSSSSSDCKPCRYRITNKPRRMTSSSSSAQPIIRRRHCRKSSSSSSSSDEPWRCQRVNWGKQPVADSTRNYPARFQFKPQSTRRSPYCKPKAAVSINEQHEQE